MRIGSIKKCTIIIEIHHSIYSKQAIRRGFEMRKTSPKTKQVFENDLMDEQKKLRHTLKAINIKEII